MVNYSPEQRPTIIQICQTLIAENKFHLYMLEKTNLEALSILLIKSLNFFFFYLLFIFIKINLQKKLNIKLLRKKFN